MSAASAAVEALNRVGALETAYGTLVEEVRAELDASKPAAAPLALPAPSQPAQDLGAALEVRAQQQQTLLVGALVLAGLWILRRSL